MAARARIVVAAGLVVLVLAALVAATSDGIRLGGVDVRREPTEQTADDERRGDRPVENEDRSGGQRSPAMPERGVNDLSRLTTLVILLVVVAVALAVLVSFRVALRRRRLQGDRPLRAGPPPMAVEVPIDDEPIGEVLEEQLLAVDEGSPRNAIVAAWVRLEEFATAQGMRRQPADTPAEFVARALAAYSLDAAALDRLAELYREARFSEHPLTERHRRDARACLAVLVGSQPHGTPR